MWRYAEFVYIWVSMISDRVKTTTNRLSPTHDIANHERTRNHEDSNHENKNLCANMPYTHFRRNHEILPALIRIHTIIKIHVSLEDGRKMK